MFSSTQSPVVCNPQHTTKAKLYQQLLTALSRAEQAEARAASAEAALLSRQRRPASPQAAHLQEALLAHAADTLRLWLMTDREAYRLHLHLHQPLRCPLARGQVEQWHLLPHPGEIRRLDLLLTAPASKPTATPPRRQGLQTHPHAEGRPPSSGSPALRLRPATGQAPGLNSAGPDLDLPRHRGPHETRLPSRRRQQQHRRGLLIALRKLRKNAVISLIFADKTQPLQAPCETCNLLTAEGF